jgi:hypothetical protein
MRRHVIAQAVSAALLGTGLLVGAPAQAANWLQLQGTEPAGAADRVNLWGFVQVQYQKDYSDPNDADGYIPPKLIGPYLDSQETFNVNRARIGMRGTGLPLDSNVNYFLLAEFGRNGLTVTGDGYTPSITDASITLNHIPHARVRLGLFKYPGAEEGLQAIHVFDYVNFTEVTNQLLLERPPNKREAGNVGEVTLPVDGAGLLQFDDGVGAFRDVGIQVFDWFQTGAWEHSYAVMLGNGNGVQSDNWDDEYDTYLYWASEWVFGGAGPRREGLKLFIWSQDGKRLVDQTIDGTYDPQKFDRERQGLGFKYLRGPFRVASEYMQGEGMIFVGPDKPTYDQNGAGPAANGADGEAYGWYVDLGWRIPSTKWELDLRYDQYHRLSDDPGPPGGPSAGRSFESVWKATTLGVQYHFNRKTRATLNYAIRDVKTPDWPPNTGPNANMDGIGDRLAFQVTHIF